MRPLAVTVREVVQERSETIVSHLNPMNPTPVWTSGLLDRVATETATEQR